MHPAVTRRGGHGHGNLHPGQGRENLPFSRNEALEEAITVSVTAKLAVFDEWVEVAA